MSPRDIRWMSELDLATGQFDGGPRSFPPTCESSFAHTLRYDPPNKDYAKLFSRLAKVSNSQGDALLCPHSAGWLLPDDNSVCKPVFIANSLMSAIWLLKETLYENALPAEAWEQLVSAAQKLAKRTSDSFQEEPPPTQRTLETRLLPTKRAAASTSALPSKRLRPATSISTLAVLQPEAVDEAEEPEQPVEQQEALNEPICEQVRRESASQITTISRKNRRADRMRAKKLVLMQAQENFSVQLARPPESASYGEHAAYASISRQDEPFVSWILQQQVNHEGDLLSSTETPYLIAIGMLEKVCSIGNASSQASAAAFLRNWRSQGSPFAQESMMNGPPTASRSCWFATTPQSALASAWSLCDRYEQDLSIIHTKYRWAMAYLGKAYSEKVEQIKAQDNLLDSQARSEAIDALTTSATSSTNQQQRRRFRRRMHQALRWYKATSRLGWGILCLMPHEVVTKSWVENDLRVHHWEIWLELIENVHPIAHKASMALDESLGPEGISGGSISDKVELRIEVNTRFLATQAGEIGNDEVKVGETGNDNVETAPSQGTPKSRALLLRQSTLIELCKPSSGTQCV